MMKVITGEKFNTSLGIMIVYNEQDSLLKVGDDVSYNNQVYKVESVVAPTKPGGKWSIRV